MNAAFLLYSLDKEERLNVYYTLNSVQSRAFVAAPSNPEQDIIYDVLQDLELDIDSTRVTYMGTFNFDGFSSGENSIDAIAINVSSLNMKPIMDKWNLKENLAFEIGREENSFILALMMKLMLNLKKLAKDVKKDDEEDKYI